MTSPGIAYKSLTTAMGSYQQIWLVSGHDMLPPNAPVSRICNILRRMDSAGKVCAFAKFVVIMHNLIVLKTCSSYTYLGRVKFE